MVTWEFTSGPARCVSPSNSKHNAGLPTYKRCDKVGTKDARAFSDLSESIGIPRAFSDLSESIGIPKSALV